MVDQLEQIDEMIQAGDDLGAVEHLEQLSLQRTLHPGDRVALALMLMMPPFADYEASNTHLLEVCKAGGTNRVEAAVWGEYIYLNLYPAQDEFLAFLQAETTSAEAYYLLACSAEYHGDLTSARASIERSLGSKRFPNALLLAARISTSPSERESYRREAESLVRVRDAECHPVPHNRRELRERYWSELILGERLTSEVWKHTYRQGFS